MTVKPFFFLILAPFALACAGSPQQAEPAKTASTPAAAPQGPHGTASISGKVTFEGKPPAPEKINLTSDPKCVEAHPDGLVRSLIQVKDGGLKDVLVSVKSGLAGSYPAPTQPATLDQRGCDYTPRMVVVQVDQPLLITNDDDTLHNVHPRPQINEEFNVGQPDRGMQQTEKFKKPELLIPVGCDVHPWMRAWISVVSNPFWALTKDDGSFEIKGLPAGSYEVEVAHGKLPPVTRRLELKDGEAATLDVALKES
jgi:hypothetical protein